ncbi:MAG: LysM peptidoglycan-binding domain-containing protein [Clostridia bacterium]|nr:LysM peptidoglycan-binding domain-containing protein [Clostridia bacterium]
MSETRSNCAYNYTVKRGDSFYLIAQRLNVNLRDLLEANPNVPPARLTIGDILCIPYCSADSLAQDNSCCPTAEPGCGSGNTGNGGNTGNQPAPETPGYTCPANRRTVVQAGQTAGDLQLRYNLSYHTLKTANSDKDLNALKGGDIVCIPAENIACPTPVAVALKEGDSLESIASQNNVSVASLLQANPCLAPQDFKAGVTVRLPE